MKLYQALSLYIALGEGLALAVLFLIDYFGVTAVSRAGMAVCAGIYVLCVLVYVVLDGLRPARRGERA